MANLDEVEEEEKRMATSATLATGVSSQHEAKRADHETTSPKYHLVGTGWNEVTLNTHDHTPTHQTDNKNNHTLTLDPKDTQATLTHNNHDHKPAHMKDNKKNHARTLNPKDTRATANRDFTGTLSRQPPQPEKSAQPHSKPTHKQRITERSQSHS